MEILLIILSQIMHATPFQVFPITEIKIDDLPVECRQVYDPFLRKARNATTTQAVSCDLDGDGRKEWIVWDGNSGSGGQGWVVFTEASDGSFKSAGNVFGSIYKLGKGILVSYRCGWELSVKSYYELQNGKLVQLYRVDVVYRHSSEGDWRTIIRKISVEILEKK